MSSGREHARQPEDLARLFVERANEGDTEGLTALYEADAVLAYPPGQTTEGHEAIQSLYERMVSHGLRFELEQPLPTVYHGELALTSSYRRDGNGIRVQVARRQPDGSWLRIIDRPESPESPS